MRDSWIMDLERPPTDPCQELTQEGGRGTPFHGLDGSMRLFTLAWHVRSICFGCWLVLILVNIPLTGADICLLCSIGYSHVFCSSINYYNTIYWWLVRQGWPTPCTYCTHPGQCLGSTCSSLCYVLQVANILSVYWWISTWHLWLLHDDNLGMHGICGRHNRGVQNFLTVRWAVYLTVVSIYCSWYYKFKCVIYVVNFFGAWLTRPS